MGYDEEDEKLFFRGARYKRKGGDILRVIGIISSDGQHYSKLAQRDDISAEFLWVSDNETLIIFESLKHGRIKYSKPYIKEQIRNGSMVRI